ncbi:MAG: murein transglycosylase A [Burkholderiales bacterium]|nr:murein transglycosylase A [Burkholderiales bacterium]
MTAAGCAVAPPAPEPAPPQVPAVATTAPSIVPADPRTAPPVPEPSAPLLPPVAAPSSGLVPAAFSELPGWQADDHASALKAFQQGCSVLAAREAWRNICQAARKLGGASAAVARRFFETEFQVYRALNDDGAEQGLITGYYEPLLHGSRKPSARYRFPLYGVPEDLLVVDLGELYPDLKGLRLRGRLDGRRVVPYYSRAQIERKEAPLNAKVLYWVDDPIELFFLQVQGSGQIRLDTGERVRIGYGDQNGHPYRSIGRFLIDRGELGLEQASMQGIKAWAQRNPDKLAAVLHHNASYVFFRELAADLPGPLGALGVALSAGRSLAVDPRYIPLGAPVFLATTWPSTKRPLERLMMAQDTGSAIRGGVRGDYFWGYGEQAGAQAGRMQQSGRLWVLVPLGLAPHTLLRR